ncbi:MAG: LPXTG cell wall anchor domain-containing protein [Chloroflexi bacterium]|nr:LPXTG cell wall anchor domain-containing protein [Chloroflexota bacterium]
MAAQRFKAAASFQLNAQGGTLHPMSKARIVILTALVLLLFTQVLSVSAQTEEDETAVRNLAIISDGEHPGDTITYTLVGVEQPGAGRVLQGWLVTDNGVARLSTGTMTVGASGTLNHTYVSPTGENLLQRYSKIEITLEPVPDPSPNSPSKQAIWSAKIPFQAVNDVRSLLDSWSTLSENGSLIGLRKELAIALSEAQLAQTSTTLEELQDHIQKAINVIEGSGGTNYSPEANDSGDGVGVLTYAATSRSHAVTAAADAPDNPEAVMHGAGIQTTISNVDGWVREARDQALVVLVTDELVAAKIQTTPMIGLLNGALNGIDTDGDSVIRATPGEGGAAQAYREAQFMATLVFQPGGLPRPIDLGPGLPSTGDSTLAMLPLAGLAIAGILTGLGTFFLIRKRRAFS